MIHNVLARQLQIGQAPVDDALEGPLESQAIAGPRRSASRTGSPSGRPSTGRAWPRACCPSPEAMAEMAGRTFSNAPTPADRRLAPVVRLAPAKLNMALAVDRRRDDGYHELHSVMVPLALADRLSLAPAAGTEDTLWVSGFDAGPLAANLVLRAIAEVRAALGRAVPCPALAARLEKRIPVAAGLAGGSSDAAAAIDGALDAWSAGDALDEPALAELRRRVAARLGSDVPFFLAGTAAVVTGRGEHVEPLRPLRGTAPGCCS